jgi:hypothetical protein
MKIPRLKDFLKILNFEKNGNQITILDQSEPFEVWGTPRTIPYLPLATYLNTKILKVRDYPVGEFSAGLEIVVPDDQTYDFENEYFCPDLEFVLKNFDLKTFTVRIDLEDSGITNLFSGKFSEIPYNAVADYLSVLVFSIDTDASDLEGKNILTITLRKTLGKGNHKAQETKEPESIGEMIEKEFDAKFKLF